MKAIGVAIARFRDKQRKGLLGLWAFERATAALRRLGLGVHLSVAYQEGTEDGGPPAIRLTDCTISLAAPEDAQEIAAVESYPLPVGDLRERFGRGAGCYLLRHCGSIAAFTWFEVGGPPRPRLGLTFGPQDVYLFDAHTAPAYRGLNLLPFLRHRLYRDLEARGHSTFLSSTVCFNRPAHRFKQKLGAKPWRMTLYLSLFGRMQRVFVLRRYAAATIRAIPKR